MLHQQEQQWQQLQQQKQALLTQPVLTDSTVLQQQISHANSYKKEMSLQAPQVMTTKAEAISISGNLYQTDTTERSHNLMQHTPAMLSLPVTSAAQYGQTPVSYSLQQNIAMQSLPETANNQYAQVPTSVSVQQNTFSAANVFDINCPIWTNTNKHKLTAELSSTFFAIAIQYSAWADSNKFKRTTELTSATIVFDIKCPI